jgi:hypothetical protein
MVLGERMNTSIMELGSCESRCHCDGGCLHPKAGIDIITHLSQLTTIQLQDLQNLLKQHYFIHHDSSKAS